MTFKHDTAKGIYGDMSQAFDAYVGNRDHDAFKSKVRDGFKSALGGTPGNKEVDAYLATPATADFIKISARYDDAKDKIAFWSAIADEANKVRQRVIQPGLSLYDRVTDISDDRKNDVLDEETIRKNLEKVANEFRQ